MLSIAELEAKILILESELLNKDAVIAEQVAAISERDNTIKNLTGDLEYARFQNEQMRRFIFGSKRERFVPQTHPDQLTFDFWPQVAEIEIVVQEEREKMRIEYERETPKKKASRTNESARQPARQGNHLGTYPRYHRHDLHRPRDHRRAGLRSCQAVHQPLHP